MEPVGDRVFTIYPIEILLFPVVFVPPAETPIAIFRLPVVLLMSPPRQIVVFSLPVVLKKRAPTPNTLLAFPVVPNPIAEAQTTVLSSPATLLLDKDQTPMAVLLLPVLYRNEPSQIPILAFPVLL